MKKNLICLIFINFILMSPIKAEDYSPEISKNILHAQQQMRKYLSAGEIEQARNILETAADNYHSVEIELGIIQTLMQAGEYKHALSAAAHTQAEHPNSSDANLFYAWLLVIAGQQAQAVPLLESYLQEDPTQESVKTMWAQIKSYRLDSEKIITSNAIKLSPFSSKNQEHEHSTFLASGLIVNHGKQILVLRSSIGDTQYFSVRTSRGNIHEANRDLSFESIAFALLKLSQPLKINSQIRSSYQKLSMGKPIYWIGFNQNKIHKPEWPILKTDVTGIAPASGDTTQLHLASVESGGLVFNTKGELIGLSQTDLKKNTQLISFNSELEFLFDQEKTPQSIITMDEIYETSLNNLVLIYSEAPK